MTSYINSLKTVFNRLNPLPKTPGVAMVATGMAWYGKRVVETYGPGFLAEAFATKCAAYAPTILTGATYWTAKAVAPICVPSVTPFVAAGTGIALGYGAIAVGNYVHDYFAKAKKQNKVVTV